MKKDDLKKLLKSKTTRLKILKLIEKSESFTVIFNEDGGNQISYADYNMTNGEIIVACEVVKAKILKNCNKRL